jgi:hypothetical protein
MATAIELLDVNMLAGSDLSTKQFFIVKQNGTVDTVDITSAVTDRPYGVIADPPKSSGKACAIQTDGVAKVVSDGSGTAIAAGDQVGTDASGRAVKCTTQDRPLLGEAMDASTAAGTVIRVKLKPGVPFRTPA